MGLQTLFSAVLGIVQGISEFLPISSSGHLMVAEKLLALAGYDAGGLSSLALIVMLHFGTLVAVAAAFWKDWVRMLRHPVRDRTLLMLFVASLPALAVKLLLGDLLDSFFTGWFLGIAFLVTALFLCLIQLLGGRGRHSGRSGDVTAPRALLMGAFQSVAMLPGVSRSGSTLLGGVAGGLGRTAAVRFSFMMSAPAILASFAVEVKGAADTGGLDALLGTDVLVGVALAAVSGWLAIRYMLRLIERVSFFRFALYVAAVGAAVIALQLTGFAGFPPIALPGSAAVLPVG